MQASIAGANSNGAWRPDEAAAPGQAEFISFAVGGDRYAVDAARVRGVKGWSEVTAQTRKLEHVCGEFALRGVMVPVVDLRARFGQGTTDAEPMHVVIVVTVGEQLVGLLADRLLDVVSVETTQIQPVPQIANALRITYLSGLVVDENRMIAVIDLNNLLAAETSGESPGGHEQTAAAAAASAAAA